MTNRGHLGPDHPAWKIADAARLAVDGNNEALETALRELKPTTTVIAQAYQLSFSVPDFTRSSGVRMIIARAILG
jgi:hypothetical protein